MKQAALNIEEKWITGDVRPERGDERLAEIWILRKRNEG